MERSATEEVGRGFSLRPGESRYVQLLMQLELIVLETTAVSRSIKWSQREKNDWYMICVHFSLSRQHGIEN